MRHELRLKRQGASFVAGVDEVGIGPLAGPVVAAAVILRDDVKIKGLDDSKRLTHGSREKLYGIIIDSSVSIGIGIVDSCIIDRINILQASLRAMEAAVNSLSEKPDHILVDGIRKIPGIAIPQTSIKYGDSIASVIAIASIIAKVFRDRLMEHYDRVYPHYEFSIHKGYGTKRHFKLLGKFGPTAIHRLSYQPVMDCLIAKGLMFI
ncbi:MAG: ribonuclease HII [bacterium]